jgi:Carboxypeptidase regulatory-like domain
MTGDWRRLTRRSHYFFGRLYKTEQAIDAQAISTVQRSQVKLVVLALMLTATSVSFAASSGAIVSGVVRDNQGVAQMGALVQVLASDSVAVASALTDVHGHYLISSLLPGKYDVRASAALLMPAKRGNLQLGMGTRTTVNLTLSSMLAAVTWLPAERRKADEPDDDWKWTLRSTANRPILRIFDDGTGLPISISSSATETVRPSDQAVVSVLSGGGELGQGGMHNVITVDRVLVDGADVVFRSDIGSVRVPLAGRPSTEVQVGFQRRFGLGGTARSVLSIQTHPEIMGSNGVSGLNVVQSASAERIVLGDMAEIEAGGSLSVVRTAGYMIASRPFVRVMAHPSENWSVGYSLATSQGLQSYEALDTIQPELPVAVMWNGRLQMENGLHQEISVGRKAGRAMIQVAYYRDALDRVAISGTGPLTVADLSANSTTGVSAPAMLADTTNGSFRFLANGYSTQGAHVIYTQTLTPALWAAFEYSSGAALASDADTPPALSTLPNGFKAHNAQTATVALKGTIAQTGTRVRAAYRWEPAHMVTAVDPYSAFSDQAFLSCYIRQQIKLGHMLPPGLEATVDVTNLLAEGYRPFLSADGRTLYLAQAPRTLQAGLAFTF